ncbi:dTDP-glucose 4,6-dehydratase [uncultured Sporomusa sp.]|uniref:dTDP-glucose 4,6-dehydratase n=1 Tax=uncultured Sporomusa sp. TaxID=307249 RepID=A0A212LZ43_9FIRM|nr:dTDP-glucose 4,6-dehydratase [uncultured Sporomusa sp.]SCM82803.1 dTDP-glucose 4,6-dehydratase [uncultured Sporomusa sp.]
MRTLLITGGAGFIGSNFVHYIMANTNYRVINLDNLTYAGNLHSLASIRHHPRHIFIKGSIQDSILIKHLLDQYQPEGVVHLAAESHVDRSINGPGEFVHTNIVGTFELLECVRHYWVQHDSARKAAFRFLHVSTDEVYGSLGPEGYFSEDTKYAPNSPYAASKAAADHLVRAYFHTYGLPVLITNCSNNYGPYQFPEKLIPLMILTALKGERLPIYGDGGNVRDWLFVLDHCSAILKVLAQGQPGEVYNVGGNNEKTNLQVVQSICDLLDRLQPSKNGRSYRELITFVTDRPGHDRRYAINSSKLKAELGWIPQESFETGLAKTVSWYLDNLAWCDGIGTVSIDHGE